MTETTELTKLLGGRVLLEQPAHGYRVAIDSVLVAAAVPAQPGDRVLDAGAGTGAILLCLAARVTGLTIQGIENAPDHAILARRNIDRNAPQAQAVQTQIELIEADLLASPAPLAETFDHVVTNPPFHEPGRHRLPIDRSKMAADHAIVDLRAWLAACQKRVASNGWLICIHKTEALGEIIESLGTGFGDLTIIPLWPRQDGSPAKRVIVRARKGSRGPLRLMQGLTLHGSSHSYTKEADAILRDAQGFGELR